MALEMTTPIGTRSLCCECREVWASSRIPWRISCELI